MTKTVLFAAGVAVSCLVMWTTRAGRRGYHAETAASAEAEDVAGEDSFPASDPPSYSGAHA